MPSTVNPNPYASPIALPIALPYAAREAQRFFLLGGRASESPPSAPRLAAEPAAKNPRLGGKWVECNKRLPSRRRIGDFGQAWRLHRNLPLGPARRDSAAPMAQCRDRSRETPPTSTPRRPGLASLRELRRCQPLRRVSAREPHRWSIAASRKTSTRPSRRRGRSARTAALRCASVGQPPQHQTAWKGQVA